MSAPLHLLHRFTTDEAGEYSGYIARHPGGWLMRVAHGHVDGSSSEAEPRMVFTSTKSGVATQVWDSDDSSQTPPHYTDLFQQIPAGHLVVEVTDADSDTEYVVALTVEPNRIRRHSVSISLDADGNGTATFDLNDGGLLQTIAVTSADDVDGETVNLVVHNLTRWPEIGDVNMYLDGGDKVVGDPASQSLWGYAGPGALKVDVTSALPEDTTLRVLFDIMAP